MSGSYFRPPFGRRKKNLKIAFELVYEGWHLISWHPEYDEKKELFTFGFLRRKDFKNYLTEIFFKSFTIWSRYRKFGLPSGMGYLNEAGAIIEMLELFDGAFEVLKEKEVKKNAGN